MERSVIRGRLIPDFAEFIIGPAHRVRPLAGPMAGSGRTRWLHPGYGTADSDSRKIVPLKTSRQPQPRSQAPMAIDLSDLRPGLAGSAELKVAVEHTAPSIGSGLVPVLATPVMINVIEAAALAAVEHLLAPRHQSLRIPLYVRHFAAPPSGLRGWARARIAVIA